MTQTSSQHICFRGRSFPVLALEPDAPLDGWMQRLDKWLERSPAFFASKSIVVDVSALGLDRPGVTKLVESLSGRGIRIMGLTGVEPTWASDDIPPILTGGRAAAVEAPKISDAETAIADAPAAKLSPDEQTAFDEIGRSLDSATEPASPTNAAPEPRAEQVRITPLLVNAPVRSGQSIFHPDGDVTVIGSIASGADVLAGGSVHVYGTIRGRVMAGAYGETEARIFCRRLEAELLAIGGHYIVADEIDPELKKQPIQAWLEKQTVKIAKLD